MNQPQTTTCTKLTAMPAAVLAEILDQSAMIILAVDHDGRITAVNDSFLHLAGRQTWDPATPLSAVFGDALDVAAGSLLEQQNQSHPMNLQLHGMRWPGGTEQLACLVFRSGEGWLICGRQKLTTDHEIIDRISKLNNDLTNAYRDMRRQNQELEAAHAQIRKLHDLLPVCSHCKKVRNDDGYWQEMEQYISENLDTEFSHGICEDCLRKKFPEFAEKILAERSQNA